MTKYPSEFKCFLDLDGVLVDCMTGAHQFHGIEYDYDKYPYPYAEWDCLPPDTAELTTKEFWDSLDRAFWERLPWMPDGKKILEIVESFFDKEQICILTAPTRAASCAAGKMRWIQEHLPEYSRRFFIGSAKGFCASGNSILVDDADHNTIDFGKAGGHAILVPRKWNNAHKWSSRTAQCVRNDLDNLRRYLCKT